VPAKAGSFRYHGYYRHGERAVFAYEREGAEWLESAVNENGAVVVKREHKGDGPLTELTRGGAAQWPQTFTTRGRLGDAQPYAFDELTPPAQTPWNSLWHFGDHDFFPNGDAALCTMEGEVWIVSGIDASLSQLKWRRFAAGLNQAMGLRIVDGEICVLGRDQITRLHDLNGDGEADFYECLCNAYSSAASGHDFILGLQRDNEGRFIFASGLQGVVRTSADMKSVEVLATGLRNPNGPGLGPNGEIAVAPQEGDWTPASMVCEFTPDPKVPPHFGHGGPKPGPLGHVPPLVYLPRGEDNSSGGQCYVEGARWGVPAGSLIHFSWGMGSAFLVLRERTGDGAQGCVVRLPGSFRSGPHRGHFHPVDGQLYVTGMTGWITYTPDAGCFTRVRYTGGSVRVPRATEARDNGVLLHFAEPLDKAAASDTSKFFAQQWNYRYGASYGSDEYSLRTPDQPGHDPLEIKSAHLLPDGCSVFLEIPQLQPTNILHLHGDVPGVLTRDFFLTLHRLGPAFTDFPGYQAIAKTPIHEHHIPAPTAIAPKPVKWEQGEAGRALKLQTAASLQYAQKELRAKAGERLSLTFENPDAMPHNWVLVKPGSVERVGALANAFIAAPDALARHYVPESADILCHARVLDPQKTTTIHFTAPAQPGQYPYICTFPGHWAVMRGVLIVE
jgi:azurin